MNYVFSFHTDLLSQQRELDFLEQPFMLDFGDILLFSPERSLKWPFSHWQCGLQPGCREIMELAAVIQIIHPLDSSILCAPSWHGLGTWASLWVCDPEVGMAGVETGIPAGQPAPTAAIPAGKMGFLCLITKVFCCFSY